MLGRGGSGVDIMRSGRVILMKYTRCLLFSSRYVTFLLFSLRRVPVLTFFFLFPFCTSLPLNFLRFALELSALISPEQRDYCGGVSVPPCSLPRVSVLRRSFETFPVFSARTLRRIYR